MTEYEIACVNFSGKYGINSGKEFYEKIEQKNCDEITYIWYQKGNEILRVTKKTGGVMSSNAPVQNEYALIKHESDHIYYVSVQTDRVGFVEGTEYKLSNGDIKRTSRRHYQGTVTEYVDILPWIN